MWDKGQHRSVREGAARGETQMNQWRRAIQLAARSGIPKRALIVALVVGSGLNLINQGDALFSGGHLNWLKVALTYAVPFVVSTHGAVSARMANPAPK